MDQVMSNCERCHCPKCGVSKFCLACQWKLMREGKCKDCGLNDKLSERSHRCVECRVRFNATMASLHEEFPPAFVAKHRSSEARESQAETKRGRD